jgi:hypothetical protein
MGRSLFFVLGEDIAQNFITDFDCIPWQALGVGKEEL